MLKKRSAIINIVTKEAIINSSKEQTAGYLARHQRIVKLSEDRINDLKEIRKAIKQLCKKNNILKIWILPNLPEIDSGILQFSLYPTDSFEQLLKKNIKETTGNNNDQQIIFYRIINETKNHKLNYLISFISINKKLHREYSKYIHFNRRQTIQWIPMQYSILSALIHNKKMNNKLLLIIQKKHSFLYYNIEKKPVFYKKINFGKNIIKEALVLDKNTFDINKEPLTFAKNTIFSIRIILDDLIHDLKRNIKTAQTISGEKPTKLYLYNPVLKSADLDQYLCKHLPISTRIFSFSFLKKSLSKLSPNLIGMIPIISNDENFSNSLHPKKKASIKESLKKFLNWRNYLNNNYKKTLLFLIITTILLFALNIYYKKELKNSERTLISVENHLNQSKKRLNNIVNTNKSMQNITDIYTDIVQQKNQQTLLIAVLKNTFQNQSKSIQLKSINYNNNDNLFIIRGETKSITNLNKYIDTFKKNNNIDTNLKKLLKIDNWWNSFTIEVKLK